MEPSGNPADNAFLSGVFTPVFDELDASGLPVEGTLPEPLDGWYLRNGPNPQFPPLGAYHAFDGDGMVHGIEIRDGHARYRNRWVLSKGLMAERARGRALYGGLSEFRTPDADVIAEAGILKNTANTHLTRIGGRLLALLEAARPTEITPELDTIGEYDFGGALRGPMTAHPKIDPVTGEAIFFGYSPTPPYVRLHVVDATGTLIHTRAVDLPAPVMMHDFAVTRSRIVLFDLPARFDLTALLAGDPGVRWDPSNGARIGVLDRQAIDAEVRWIEVEPFYVFHFLNAHDDGDRVVVTGCRSDRLGVTFGPDAGFGEVDTYLHRWTIDPEAGIVTDEPLDDRRGDFPRINDEHAMDAARYGYVGHAATWSGDGVLFDGVVKHDFATGDSRVVTYGPRVASGEAAFAPDPTRSGEDDGWLMNFVHDLDSEESAFVVLDAATLETVARVALPRRVPSGFHGSWFPSAT